MQEPADRFITNMSWTVQYIGKPENIIKALNEYSAKLNGASKTEFDAALPHFIGLIQQNFNQHTDPVLKISANGHGHDGYRTCSVTIENLNGVLV